MAAKTSVPLRLALLALIAGCDATSGMDAATQPDADVAGGGVAGGGGSAQTDGGAAQTTDGGADGGAAADSAAGNGGADAGAPGTYTRTLFNGVDFSNWDRYLGKPSPTEPALGLNQDPQGVYSVVMADGAPAIRVSGEIWGSLISKDEYCDFELHLEYKWGTKSWPPLNTLDSGIMVLSTGPLGAVNAGGSALSDPVGSGGFMVSMEYQLTPGDIGGMYNLGPITFANASRVVPVEQAGTWNQVAIVHRQDTLTFLLNGVEVAQGSSFRLAWPGQPDSALTCGKLQLQSEGGEILFRNIEIQVLAQTP